MYVIKKNILLGALLGLGLCAFGQDTIKVGINDQMIQVSSPENNQKVSIIIEDSITNYKVEISRYDDASKASTLKKDLLTRTKRKKSWTSRLFGELEVGYSGLAFKQTRDRNFFAISDSAQDFFVDSIFNIGPVGNYRTQTFATTGRYWGFYADLTIQEKTRQPWNAEVLRWNNGTHLRFTQNFVKGSVNYREMYGFEDNRPDSIVSSDARHGTLSVSALQLTKRYTMGVFLNKAKDLSLEYGVDLGLRLELSNRTLFSNSEFDVAGPVTQEFTEQSFVSNALFTFNHRLGINYRRFSLNAGLSFGDLRLGSFQDNFIIGKRVTTGIAYRW